MAKNNNGASEKATLSMLQAAGYCLGGMHSLIYQASFLSYMLLPFLTNVAGFSMTAAAAIYSASTLIKIIATLVAGVIVDSVNFKSGKFRTWTLIGGVLLLITSICFYKFNLSEGVYTVVFFILFFLNQLAYQFHWNGTRSLVGCFAKNGADNVLLTSAAQIGTSLGGIIFGLIYIKLIQVIGGTQSYFWSLFIYGIVGLAGAITLFLMAKNYEGSEAPVKSSSAKKVSFVEMLSALKGQGLVWFIATIFGNTQSGFFATLVYYFTTYVLKNPYMASLAVTFANVGNFVGALAAPALSTKITRKAMYIWSHYISAIFYVLMFFLGKNAVMFLILRTLCSAAGTFAGVSLPATANDLADYNEMKNISAARGFTQALLGLSIRIGIFLSGVISSFGLAKIGFDIATAADGLSASVETGIMALLGIGPAIVCVIAGLIVQLFYKIDEAEVDEYRRQRAAANAAK